MSTARVIVASTRAAAGHYTDRSGPIAVQFLRRAGFDTPDATVVADADVADAVRDALAQKPRVLLTSGGTGVTADDRTVEAVTPLITQPLPGIVHAFYARSLESVPTAVLSRAIAGMAGETFVFTMPGSPGGVKDGCAVLEPVLDHLTDLAASASPSPDPTRVAEEVGQVCGATVTAEPLSAPDIMTRAMGALVQFNGVVRDHDHGADVAALRYEAHPSAEAELTRICADIAATHPVRVWAGHRTGDVPIGETAFLVSVASAHRHDAFTACAEIADRVKAEVPIWKEQTLADGATEWVGIDG